MLRQITMLLALAIGTLSITSPATAQRGVRPAPAGSWELLGETRVGFGVDRDTISVGRDDSHFRTRSYDRLRLSAERGDIQLRAVKVRYINGFQEDIAIDQLVRAGQSTEVRLPERRSFLSQIELVYAARGAPGLGGGGFFGGNWRRPIMKVYGFNSGAGLPPPPAAGPRPNWMLLGENTVSFRGDRDVIRLANDENWYRSRSFDKLHFQVSDGDVEMREIRIVYINGYTETIRVGRELRRGTDLTVDLPGDRSYLRQIEMTYRARPGSFQRPTLKVYGEGRGR